MLEQTKSIRTPKKKKTTEYVAGQQKKDCDHQESGRGGGIVLSPLIRRLDKPMLMSSVFPSRLQEHHAQVSN